MLTLLRCPFHPRVTAVARKRPGHSAKSAGSRFHLNTHTPVANEVGVGWLCRRSCKVREPIRKRVHTQLVWEHPATVISAPWAAVGWSYRKSGIRALEPISTSKKKKKEKCRQGMKGRTFSQKFSQARKWPPQNTLFGQSAACLIQACCL